MLQRKKSPHGGYHIRCSPDTLKRFTSLAVRPEYLYHFRGTNKFIIPMFFRRFQRAHRLFVSSSVKFVALGACESVS